MTRLNAPRVMAAEYLMRRSIESRLTTFLFHYSRLICIKNLNLGAKKGL